MLAKLGFSFAKPLLHAMDAEQAHDLTLKSLCLLPKSANHEWSSLRTTCFGLDFPNPLGLAAGFDKNAEVPDAMLNLGFGFTEIGTVTPRPQQGNPTPRLFRLLEDQAVINRMGFNNEGHSAALARLRKRKSKPGIVGVNLGANKDARDRIADYVAGITAFADVASYFTINISSPNTPGLRTLQSAEELRPLLDRLNEARQKASRRVPMLLKVAPDLADEDLQVIAECTAGGAVDGVILTNTTIKRPELQSPHAREQGGLSGAPLYDLSTEILARFFLLTEGRIPLIGVGGISSASHAWEKISAGASLLQIYSALVFQGPALVEQILFGLEMRLRTSGYATLAEARGVAAERIAHQKA